MAVGVKTSSEAGTAGAFSSIPAEALFLVSAITQYVSASIAVKLFAEVDARIVAWFRLIGAAAALVTFALLTGGRFWRGWTRSQWTMAAIFGTATAGMNLCFYIAISHLDLGKSVAIEFIGPIAVAAAMTRTTRNALALCCAVIGVVVLGGTEVSANAVGLLFILMASALWALYIVMGSRVANAAPGVSGLAIGLTIGALVIAPIGAPGSGYVWSSPRLLMLACLTGVLANAIGYGIDQVVLRRIPIRRFSVMLALLPATALAIGWIALGQRPGRIELIGVALVLVGVAIQERDHLPTPIEGELP